MRPVRRRWVIGIALIAISLSMLAWGIWPEPIMSRVVMVNASETRLGEQRILKTEWPASVRVGDDATIRLLFETSENQISGQEDSKNLETSMETGGAAQRIPTVQQTIAQARLELAGIEFMPEGVFSEALSPGRAARFIWSLRPAEAGRFPGTVWLHLNYGSQDGGEGERQVITAQVIEIEARTYLGLSGNTARILGAIGIVLGVMIGLDVITLLAAWIFKGKSERDQLQR